MRAEKPLAAGFSAEGYIIDQDCFWAVRYRGMRASLNGCGWMAAYNLRRALGQAADWDEVRRELEALHRIVRFPGPTTLRAMRLYLRRYLPEVTETAGRKAALRAAAASRAGIFRYREGREPHYVSFLREAGGGFRFFNVADGLEDCRMSMEDFAAKHLRGPVRVFTAGEAAP